MTLSIIIPTYNRSKFLEQNLEILKEHILKLGVITNDIEVVISNNCSSDSTDEVVRGFIKNYPSINVKYISQEINIGLEKNSLEVLKNASAEYVMFLGDDDYIDFLYLEGVLKHIENNTSTHVIIPSFEVVDLQGNFIRNGRDNHLPSSFHSKGFKNCLKNSWRGHQLSGLVFKRFNLYDRYVQNNLSNIYPFIYFTALSCLEGDTFHFTTYPVHVTNPGTQSKDWNYDKNAFLLDIFENYIKLPVNNLKITLLQLKFIDKQSWRLWGSKRRGYNNFAGTFKTLMTTHRTPFIFKIIFPFFIILRIFKNKVKSYKY